MNIDFFATLAKRVSVKNYCKQSIEAGLEVLNFARQLFPSEEDQKRFDWEMGHLLLQISDFKTQLRILHAERMYSLWGAYTKEYKKPIWDCKPESGKTILMVGEGGIGDEFFTAKYSHSFHQHGMKTIFATNYKSSVGILERIETIDKVIHIEEIPELEDYDFWIPAGETPLAFDYDVNDMPTHQYLKPLDEYVDKWKTIIPESDKLKVGIRWSGNRGYEVAAKTIIPFSFFDELTDIPNVEFYSLQRDEGVEDLTPDSKVIPLHDKLESWDDTIAAISQLDLVISSSTSIPVVSAAINKPTWAVLPLFPYCLWLGEETKSYWFGDITRLYRQNIVESWKEPFDKVKDDLNEWAIQKKLNRC